MIARNSIAADLARTTARATRVFTPDAAARIGGFAAALQDPGGGFRGRGRQADLYYTLFGLGVLRALRQGVPSRPLASFLDAHHPGTLDLVHLVSLIQCRRLLHPLGPVRRFREEALPALRAFMTPDGGFAEAPGAPRATPYGTYLGFLGCEVLEAPLPDRGRTAAAVCALLNPYLSDYTRGGSLNALASVALVLEALRGDVPHPVVTNRLRGFRDASGGFRAHAEAPRPDLLSTAVGAFALRRLGAPLQAGDASRTAAFVQDLWDASGGFRGCDDDTQADCEYTFYALLALGSLEA